ncbi:hypothetical protein ADK74_02530 [Streptomyces decoyicus]|nr:hypothetical protein ADK74_02530 [Streptomyces decoyicus]
MGRRPFRSGEGAAARSEKSTGGRFVDPGGRAECDAESEEGGERDLGKQCGVDVRQQAAAQGDGEDHEKHNGRAHRRRMEHRRPRPRRRHWCLRVRSRGRWGI